jgi:hypothetical protein
MLDESTRTFQGAADLGERCHIHWRLGHDRPPESECCNGPAAEGEKYDCSYEKRNKQLASHRQNTPWSRSAKAARVPRMRINAKTLAVRTA